MTSRAREGVADEAQRPLGMEALAVEGDDAGGFLAAMLQRVQAERRDGGGIRVAEDAEDAAFLAQPVAVEIEEAVIVGRCIQLVSPSRAAGSAVADCQFASAIGGARAERRSEIAIRSLGWRRCPASCSSGLGRFNRFKMVLLGIFRQHRHQPLPGACRSPPAISRS